MATQQVPVSEWLRFFNQFSKEHLGKSATIEVQDTGADKQVLADQLPLVGISADLKDNEKDITISLGGQPDSSFTHVISAPSSVEFDNASLLIHSENQGTTRLILHG